MRAFKQFATVPAAVGICIAMLWGLCALSIASIYPIASQSTSAYRLGFFSGNALTLIHKLQHERAAAAGYLSMNESMRPAKQFKKEARATDHRYAVLQKSAGRFNSDDYGTELTTALKEADALLAGLGGLRTRISDSAVSAEEAIGYYTRIIEKLTKSIFLLETQPLDHVASDQSRKAYSSIVKATELSSRGMADGAVFLGGQNTGSKRGRSWRKTSADEKALLTDYRSLATAEQRALFDVWSESKAKFAADTMRNELAKHSETAIASGKHTPAKWLKVFRQKLAGLYQIAASQQRDFIAKVGRTAARSAYLFVTLTLVASLATLVAVAWFQPVYFRHTLLALLLFGNLALIVWAFTIGPDWLVKESGPIESLQAFALAAAFFVFYANAANSKDAPRVVAIIFSCACFLLFFREVDFRVYGAPEWLIAITSGPGRRVLFVIILAILAVYVATQRRHLRAMVRPCLKWSAWPLLFWLPLLLAGEQIEVMTHATRKDGVLGFWGSGQFWEELLEFNAYVVLLFGAYVFGEIFGLRTRQESTIRLTSLKNALAAKKD